MTYVLLHSTIRGAPHQDWRRHRDSGMLQSLKTRNMVMIETTTDAVVRIRQNIDGDDRRFQNSNKMDDRMKGKIGGTKKREAEIESVTVDDIDRLRTYGRFGIAKESRRQVSRR